MITRLSASIIGLLAFAGCIFMGLVAGNPFETILLRALGGLVGGMVVGWLAGYLGQVVVHENFRQVVQADATEEAALRAENGADGENSGSDKNVANTDDAGPAGPGGGAEPAADDRELDKAAADKSRMEEDVRSAEQTVSARAARELMTNAL